MSRAYKIDSNNQNQQRSASYQQQSDVSTGTERGVIPAWHALQSAEVLTSLNSSETGLSSAEAARRLEQYGLNIIQQTRNDSVLELIWRQINNPLIYVLLGSALLALIMGKVTDGLVVLGVVVINTLIGFLQEYRANQAIAALSQMVPEECTVLRDNQRFTIPAAQVVPGDIVLLNSGDKVPSDLRLISSKNLHTDESALTGESVPVDKQLQPVAANAVIGDRRNLCFGGTLVTAGTAKGVVVTTGAGTELGRISEMLHATITLETPLTKSLARVSRYLTFAILAVAILLLLVGLLRGYNIVDATLAAITLAVAAIPEGLPAIITIALAIGVRRMASRRAIIRRLPAVETLGSTTVICYDKTGTLTRNEMTVQALWTPAANYRITGIGYRPIGKMLQDDQELTTPTHDLLRLLRGATLCNDAGLREEQGNWLIDGDPTEVAMVVAARKTGLQEQALRTEWKRIDSIPFESELKFMVTLHETPDDSNIIYLKGAPEVVISYCRRAGERLIDAQEIMAEVEKLASQGMRVLAVAQMEVTTDYLDLEIDRLKRHFNLCGLVAMIDPPRQEAIEAVQTCRQAGINVKMITGDHKTTARAIGQQLGLLTQGDVITGEQLSDMSAEQLKEVVRKNNLFARVAPEHKLRLVEALQANTHVVAMTGDGVNDAPALKRANIGVAMGITGTAVSKESADIVLSDDNFASIAAAVEEGRRVYDNLIKSLAFVLPTNIGEALMILVAIIFFPIINGTPLMPISPVQILWINLVATIALALPLAFEAKEPDVMARQPREPGSPLLNTFVLFRTVVVAVLMTIAAIGLFLYEYNTDIRLTSDPVMALKEAQTMAVTTVILFQVFYLFACRSLRQSFFKIGLFSNKIIYLGIGLILLLQAAFIYLPFMHRLFGSAPLGLAGLIKATLAALVLLPLLSLERFLKKEN